MADKIFTKGLFVNEPRQDFIKYSLSVKVEEFKQFLDENVNEKGYVNIDFLTSQNTGKDYGCVNTYEKPAEGTQGQTEGNTGTSEPKF